MRSDQSPPELVRPQAMWPLLPMTIAGAPGKVAPVTCRGTGRASASGPRSSSGRINEARYQVLGTPSRRCMSLATIAVPFEDRGAATAQLLLAAKRVSRSSDQWRVQVGRSPGTEKLGQRPGQDVADHAQGRLPLVVLSLEVEKDGQN